MSGSMMTLVVFAVIVVVYIVFELLLHHRYKKWYHRLLPNTRLPLHKIRWLALGMMLLSVTLFTLITDTNLYS